MQDETTCFAHLGDGVFVDCMRGAHADPKHEWRGQIDNKSAAIVWRDNAG